MRRIKSFPKDASPLLASGILELLPVSSRVHRDHFSTRIPCTFLPTSQHGNYLKALQNFLLFSTPTRATKIAKESESVRARLLPAARWFISAFAAATPHGRVRSVNNALRKRRSRRRPTSGGHHSSRAITAPRCAVLRCTEVITKAMIADRILHPNLVTLLVALTFVT